MKKESFASIRPKTVEDKSKRSFFGEDLFKHLDSSMWPNKSTTEPSNELSERSLILDSAKQFIEEKVAEKKPDKVNIMGAEAVLKTKDHTLVSDQNYQVMTEAQGVRVFCDQFFGQSISKYRYQDKLQSQVDYLFVSDTFYQEASLQEPEQCFIGSLSSHYFKSEAASLFSNIAKALGVQETKIAILSMKSELIDDITPLFFQELAFFKPKIIIPLGAKVTNSLLKERKRIADVHGQIFNRSMKINNEQQKLSIMPLFHPEFLSANPRMKAAAWADLQLAMKYIDSN